MAHNDLTRTHPDSAERGRAAAWLVLVAGVSLMFAFSIGHQLLFLVGTTMFPSP